MAISQIHPKYHHPAIITKADKDFLKTVDFDFKDIKFPVKTRDIHKIEKKRILSPLVFLVIKISNLCIKKCFVKKHVYYYW